MALQFSPEALREITETRKRYPTNQGALLPTLWVAQREFGWLSQEAMECVASTLDLPPCKVYTAATFYTLYKHEAPAAHTLYVCTNVSCMVLGGYDLLHHIEKRLDMKVGQTREDGRFRLEEVECLASCGTAPMMQLDEHYEENLSVARIDEILDRLMAENGGAAE